MFLKYLLNENIAYIPCISLWTHLGWPRLAGNLVITILILDFVCFATSLLYSLQDPYRAAQELLQGRARN